MFAHALSQGSLRPAEALPPTLTPNAVLAMAPPAPRRMGFLGACLVYAGCGLALTLTPELRLGNMAGAKTDGKDFVVPEEPPRVDVVLPQEKLPVPAPSRGLTLKSAPVRDKAWTPPSPLDTVPETPTTLPTQNRAFDSVRGGADTSPVMVPPGAVPNDSRTPLESAPTTVEFDFRQMRLLHRVDPVYPPLARLAKLQGDVVLLMAVDPRGVPAEVRVLSGPHPSLEQEAMRVARLWRFEPANLNGQPVSAQFRLTLQFRLR